MLQLRFFPVSQGTWVFVPVFIWIRADLSTCTNALLNHGLNFHAGHYPNPVENTHEAAANPSAQQRWNFSKNSVWRFILHILFSKTTFYHSCITANSWLTARGSFWLHMCMLREWRDTQVRCVTHPKPSESCRNAPSSVTWGTLASLRAGMKHCLPGAELDTAVTAGCSCGHSAAGHAGIRHPGEPQSSGGCLAHLPERCFHLAGVWANRMNSPSVPFRTEISRSKAKIFLLDTGLCSGVQSE